MSSAIFKWYAKIPRNSNDEFLHRIEAVERLLFKYVQVSRKNLKKSYTARRSKYRAINLNLLQFHNHNNVVSLYDK